MAQLRQFVYLDNDRLNNNLSSLGKGVPSEITRASENQTEKTGEAGGSVLGLRAGGGYGDLDRNQVETRLDITAPYRFQDLIEELDNLDIDVLKNPDVREIGRSDVVKIEAELRPMSIFKIEIAVEAIRNLASKEMRESLKTVGQQPPYKQQEIEEMDAVSTLMEQFLGSRIPLRLETEEETYCTSLNRQSMRVAPTSAFVGNTNFTVFGRVNRRISRNDSWDPIESINIISRYLPDSESSVEEFRDEIREIAQDLNVPMGSEDFSVSGRSAVIDPIAVYW